MPLEAVSGEGNILRDAGAQGGDVLVCDVAELVLIKPPLCLVSGARAGQSEYGSVRQGEVSGMMG